MEIGKLPCDDSTCKKFSEAMAEWADGDSVAQHIGHNGDFFVTNDKSGRAGTNSVMCFSNIAKLHSKYGLNVISLTELLTKF